MESEVARFHAAADDRDQNHKRYLAEASQYLRSAGDPLEVLRFLDQLMDSSFASRPQQKQALHDVGEWLGARLVRDIDVDRETLAYELGWMQRLVMIRRANERAGRPTPSAQQSPREQRSFPGFRSKIESIERRRAAAAAAAASSAPKHIKVEAPKAAVRVAPTALPDVFEAELTSPNDARDARRKARERQKAGKAKKVTWLTIKPIDALLAPLAKGLSCTLDTDGCEAVFEEMAKNNGAARSFWVSDLRSEEGRLVVGRIRLDRPS